MSTTRHPVKIYIEFWKRMVITGMKGSGYYYMWLTFLSALVLIGAVCYFVQVNQGLAVTNLTNQVSWGAYIANFTFLVGVLAVAVLLVVPAFLFNDSGFKEIVILGQLLAFATIVMCLLFITVDLGHPERFLHIMPIIGKMNFPDSILAWDVIVLNGYLAINMFIPGYLLFKVYMEEEPDRKLYLPFIIISIIWAISIHTVSAFLYAGLGGRPHWNSAVLAPRFFISAFAGGPPILMLIFKIVERHTDLKPKASVYRILTNIMTFTLIGNLFLFGCEVFKEFYTNSVHVASMQYLMFGLYGHGMLTPYIWSAIFMEVAAVAILILPSTRHKWRFVKIACVFSILGIWVEKGMGLIVPGFIPSPVGDLVEYTPSSIEIYICLGIWALGALIYTVLAKVAIAIQMGRLRFENPLSMQKHLPRVPIP